MTPPLIWQLKSSIKCLLLVASVIVSSSYCFAADVVSVVNTNLNPSSLSAGQDFKLTFSLVSSSDISNAIVDMEVRDLSGKDMLLQEFYSAQAFYVGHAQSFSWNATLPSKFAEGKYDVIVRVFNSNWTYEYLAGSTVATMTVEGSTSNSTPSFAAPILSKLTVPSTVKAGENFVFDATILAKSALTNVIVDQELRTANGTTLIHQQYLPGQNFSAGEARAYPWTTSFPENIAAGTYSLVVGIYSNNWEQTYLAGAQVASLKVISPASNEPSGSSSNSGYGSTSTSGSGSVTIGNQKSGIREPYIQPFMSSSVWNVPIGEGAKWSIATDPDTVQLNKANGYINAAEWSQPFYTGTSTDPVVTVTNKDGSHISPVTPQQIHVPIGATPAAGGDHHMNFFDLTQPNRLWSYYGCSLNNGTSVIEGITCWLGAELDACGDGLTPLQGISEYDFGIGTIRHEELMDGVIDHVLRFSASTDILKSGSSTSWTNDIQWPDVAEDSFGPSQYTGHLLFGSTVGIPASVKLSELGLTPGGLVLATALQQYGAIIRDSGGTNQIAFYAEPQDAQTSIYKQMASDMSKIVPQLRVLRDQGPTSINGGGYPLQSLAAHLDPSVCPDSSKDQYTITVNSQ